MLFQLGQIPGLTLRRKDVMKIIERLKTRQIMAPSIRGLLALPLLGAAAIGLLPAAHADSPTTAVRAADFLNSIGANSAINQRGETLAHTIECTRYLGLRWFRSGTEGNVSIPDFIELHKQTGARFSWSPGSGGTDLPKLLSTARELAKSGALLAFEGPNEPNNWGVTYGGEQGGRNKSWLPVANFQRDLYKAAKSDPVLKSYSVWGISEDGAETDNAGLQFLTVPKGARTLVPDGTQYSDYANAHNYFYHPNAPGLEDNKTWKAADPGPACKVDGLYGEYGVTWARHFHGYSNTELQTLPRVTTETGTTIGGPVTEEVHALNLLSLYLDQFKRGWSYTAMYLMRDRSDEGGNQKFGFYAPDYTPRKAAVYLHNLTTILADNGSLSKTGRLGYAIPNEPETVHDLLLQKSDGSYALVMWSELLKGTNDVTVNLGRKFNIVTVYDPTTGTAAVKTLRKADSVPLTLSDHPVVITLPAK
jgi:hypothetical protein